ncbi:MAG: FAD-binding protein, partial [Bacteroidota bacterium]
MIHTFSFACSPEEAQNEAFIQQQIEAECGPQFVHYRWKKRSIDARSRTIKINATFECSKTPLPSRIRNFTFNDVSHCPEIHIVGAGPAGLFAALFALMSDRKPVIFERGKDVRLRRRDLAQISRLQTINE